MLSRHLRSRLERIDWDFTGSPSESAFSALHWHPARLPSQVAATCIGLLSEPGDCVLDPFLGSGTTVIEAQRLGRSGIGIDLNPISCILAEAKTLPIDSHRVRKLIEKLKQEARESLVPSLLKREYPCVIPETVQKKWYTHRVRSDLGILWAQIRSSRGIKKILAQMAFSAVLLPSCRETRHWGYVCDNGTPIADHESDVLAEFDRILDRLAVAYSNRDAAMKSADITTIRPVEVICGDAREAIARMAPKSCDLVMTSPPYFGVSDYIKSQRLSMEWLEAEIEPLRLREIGARSKRHRRTALEEYLEEMVDVFIALKRVLTNRGACVLVLGESSTREKYIELLYDRLRSVGYCMEFFATRNISAQRRQYASINTESLAIITAR